MWSILFHLLLFTLQLIFLAHSIFRTFMFWICYRHLTSQSFYHLVWNVPILFFFVLVSFQVLYSNYKTGRTRLFKTETLVFLLIPVAFRMLANLLKDTSIIGFLLLMSVVPPPFIIKWHWCKFHSPLFRLSDWLQSCCSASALCNTKHLTFIPPFADLSYYLELMMVHCWWQ